ncbi:MAG: hypothetical protein M4D80_42220 [Myxococcota bacterium]|nr:hypothetical protein [Myxococcota bacterium]
MVTHRAAEPVERLTWDEICARYPDRWVALADIAWVNDTDFEFTGAEVIATFAARKEASPTMKALHAASRQSVGCFWTGELVPKNALPSVFWLR